MNTAGRIRVALLLLAAAAGLILGPAAAASAQPPITETDVSTFSDSFSGSGSSLCQDELYAFTANGRWVVHFTYWEETGVAHVFSHDHGKIVAVPLDGTGPSYTGNFWDTDSDNVRAVRHGDVLVEKDTDLFRGLAHGSDGSRVFMKVHAQVTVNANGETTVDFEKARVVCS